MAFKIESLSEMTRIASRISERQQEMQSKSTEAGNSLEALKTIITGEGVEQSISKLGEAITTNSTTVNTLFGEIAMFIQSQTSTYSGDKENVESKLQEAQSLIEGIQV